MPSEKLEVSVKVEKLNPYRLVYTGKEILTKPGEEKTFLRFYVDNEGNVYKINKLDQQMVTTKQEVR